MIDRHLRMIVWLIILFSIEQLYGFEYDWWYERIIYHFLVENFDSKVKYTASNHCGYFYWWLFCWSSASLISTFSAISTFRLVTFHRSATFCLNISTTVIFLSWWIHQLRENCYHRIKASLFHDKYWFTTVVFHSIKIDFVCKHRCWEKKNCD